MVVFKRFPKLRLSLQQNQHIVPPDKRNNYPSFTADFVILDEILMPVFHGLDNEATKQQNSYRWIYIILIFGGSLATIFAIVQLAFQSIEWPGYVEAIIAAVLVGNTAITRSFNNHERYLDTRLAAEQLRSMYFLFLRRYSPFENEQTRKDHLQREVDAIKRKVRH